MKAARYDMRAQRWAPFFDTLTFIGLDLTGQPMAMQVRGYRDQEGTPLIDLAVAAPGAEGLSVIVTTDDADVPTSVVTIQVDQDTIDATLPYPESGVRAGSDVSVFYDFKSPAVGLPLRRWVEGAFVIAAGVTQ